MSRFAASIAVHEIKPKLVEYLVPKMLKAEICEQEDLDDWDDDDMITCGFAECAIKAFNDLCKIDFSLENMTISPDEPFGYITKEQAREWLGPQKFGDLTVIGGMGGGDWEEPVAFVVYWDGKEFRGYVPTNGNSFDVKSKAAIGTAPSGSVARPFDVEAMKEDVMARIKLRA